MKRTGGEFRRLRFASEWEKEMVELGGQGSEK